MGVAIDTKIRMKVVAGVMLLFTVMQLFGSTVVDGGIQSTLQTLMLLNGTAEYDSVFEDFNSTYYNSIVQFAVSACSLGCKLDVECQFSALLCCAACLRLVGGSSLIEQLQPPDYGTPKSLRKRSPTSCTH